MSQKNISLKNVHDLFFKPRKNLIPFQIPRARRQNTPIRSKTVAGSKNPESTVRIPTVIIIKPAFLSKGSFDKKELKPNRQTKPPTIRPGQKELAIAFKIIRAIPEAKNPTALTPNFERVDDEGILFLSSISFIFFSFYHLENFPKSQAKFIALTKPTIISPTPKGKVTNITFFTTIESIRKKPLIATRIPGAYKNCRLRISIIKPEIKTKLPIPTPKVLLIDPTAASTQRARPPTIN